MQSTVQQLPGVQGDPEEFAKYLRQFGNTICGRHPIGVLLQVLLLIGPLLSIFGATFIDVMVHA